MADLKNITFETNGTQELHDDFRHFLHDEIAADFLEAWMEQCEEDEYMERVRQVIEDLTYGQEDDDGNIMKEFDIH
jgi:hypothetical protein